jgi:hypothetical protein
LSKPRATLSLNSQKRLNFFYFLMKKESNPPLLGSQQTIVVKEKGSKKIDLWSNNFLSNWFFVWVFPIIKLGKHKNPLLFRFQLREQESSRVNVESIDQAWQRELARNPAYYSLI